jgi:CheY-like chemotaxis protein
MDLVGCIPSNYLFLQKALRKKGIQVLWAKDGHEAIALIDSGALINMVLMDINMPNLNGIDAFKAIKVNHPGLVIIAQTAYARYEDETKIRAIGFDDFIGKPIKLKSLYRIIERYRQV